MQRTLDLPDNLLRRVELQAANSGKNLNLFVAELLERALAAASLPTTPARQSIIKHDPVTGFPYFECVGDAPAQRMTTEEILAMERQSQIAEDLERVGVTPR